jgi:hypothetical protein
VHWFFRDISEDPSEKELTQQDQFNNDEVALAEALVRETIQNSTDAHRSDRDPVHVRFALSEPGTQAGREFFSGISDGLRPHLDACGIAVPEGPQRLLVIEDFETTGLQGAIDRKDDGQFCGFWRRFGRSNKKGSSGGRWGLGKLVFSSSSSMRTLIGLTRRAQAPEACLMGQAILKNHRIDGAELDSVGFWCRNGDKGGQPSTDVEQCRTFAELAGLQRGDRPGLSLVIPGVLPDIEPKHLITAILKNYYFPILTGRLTATVDEVRIDAATFDRTLAEIGSEALSPSLFDFVRELQSLRADAPVLALPPAWQERPIAGDLLGDDTVSTLRDMYGAGKMLFVRAPLAVRPKGQAGPASETHVDVFLRAAQTGERSQTLVVRGAITVPTEGKRAHLVGSHAALVAHEEKISQLLGDAENPAHTQWNERAEKLRANWVGPHTVLRRVRALLGELHALVADRIERDDPSALVDFFSVPRAREPGRQRGGVVTRRMVELAPPRPKPFRIERRAGGFVLLPDTNSATDIFPLVVHLRCAYDVLNGNPFRRFGSEDFSFFEKTLTVEKHNVEFWPTAANGVDVWVKTADFRLAVTGFDQRRDLVVEAQS